MAVPAGPQRSAMHRAGSPSVWRPAWALHRAPLVQMQPVKLPWLVLKGRMEGLLWLAPKRKMEGSLWLALKRKMEGSLWLVQVGNLPLW